MLVDSEIMQPASVKVYICIFEQRVHNSNYISI